MPRLRPRGALERSALADLFKHTLSRIPTNYGRLAYLASLRDPNSGTYRHHGLIISFGLEASIDALRQSHTVAFSEWLNLPLLEKTEDLLAYLAGLDDPTDVVIRHWKQSRVYCGYVPDNTTPAQAELFSAELEILLDTLRAP